MIRKMLVGHPLHPQILTLAKEDIRKSINAPVLYTKEVQKVGMQVIDEAIDSSARKLLIVGTTGLGKTELLRYSIRQNLRSSSTAGNFHIVLVDSRSIWTQLYGSLAHEQQNNYHQFVFGTWGASNYDFSPKEAMRLLKLGKTVVLLSTTRTFIKYMEDPNLMALTSQNLAGLYYDEVHHLGAEQTWQTLNNMVRRHTESNPFLMGMSATPFHQLQNIDEFFDSKTWWAYLDSKNDFQQILKGKTRTHQVADIVDQYALSKNNGDITPLQNAYFLFPEFFNIKDLFVQLDREKISEYDLSENEFKSGFRYLLDPKYNQMLFKFLRPLLAENDKILLVATTVAQAKILEHDLQQMGYSAEALYSKMSDKVRDDVENRFTSGKTKILITVRMYDEGVDRPALSLLIDLNPLVRPKAFWQRLGRVSRLYPGKRQSNLVSFMLANTSNQKEQLELIQVLQGRPAQYPIQSVHVDAENINPYSGPNGEIEINPIEVKRRQREVFFRIKAQKFDATSDAEEFSRDLVQVKESPVGINSKNNKTSTEAMGPDLPAIELLRIEMQNDFDRFIRNELSKITNTKKFEAFRNAQEQILRWNMNSLRSESGFISTNDFWLNFLSSRESRWQKALRQKFVNTASKLKIEFEDPAELMKLWGIRIELLTNVEVLTRVMKELDQSYIRFIDTSEIEIQTNEAQKDNEDWDFLKQRMPNRIGVFNRHILKRVRLGVGSHTSIPWSELSIRSRPQAYGKPQIQRLILEVLKLSSKHGGKNLIELVKSNTVPETFLVAILDLSQTQYQSAISQLLEFNLESSGSVALEPILKPLLDKNREDHYELLKYRRVTYRIGKEFE